MPKWNHKCRADCSNSEEKHDDPDHRDLAMATQSIGEVIFFLKNRQITQHSHFFKIFVSIPWIGV